MLNVIDWSAMWRTQWPKVCLTWCAIMGCAVAWAVLTPNVYRSDAKLFVRLGRENVTVDPTASLGQGQLSALPLSRESEINTVVETLRSRVLLAHVVDELTPAAVLEDQRQMLDYFGSAPAAERETALLRIEKMVKISPIRKSNLIQVAVEAGSPEFAHAATAAFIQRFLDYHRDLNRSPGAHDFFEQQTNLLAEQVKTTQAALTALRNKTGVASLAEQKRLHLLRLSELEQEIARSAADMQQADAAIEELQRQTEELPDETVAERAVIGNPATDAMREQLYSLQIQEQHLAAKLQDAHPELQQIRAQVVAAREIFAAASTSRTNVTEARNRADEQAQLALLARTAERASLQGRADALHPQLVEAQQRLQELNAAESNLTQLERELELKNASHAKYALSLEQLRLDESLRAGQISNIAVADPPSLVHRKVKPSRGTILALATIAATLGALAVGLACWHRQVVTTIPDTSVNDLHPSRQLAMNPQTNGRYP